MMKSANHQNYIEDLGECDWVLPKPNFLIKFQLRLERTEGPEMGLGSFPART